MNATELAQQRSIAFASFLNLQEQWTSELEEAGAIQNYLSASQTYPLLKGMHTNLFKCFMLIGWLLVRSRGVVGYLHPEGPYDDPQGGLLREAMYARLRSHFQFKNELRLFADVDNSRKYSINIYGSPRSELHFDQIANLFIPATIDACYAHGGTGIAGGYKNESGKWNTAGHADRIIAVGEEQLAIFATLYDEPGTMPKQARLPALHAGRLSSALSKIAAYPHRLADCGDGYFSTGMFNETTAKDDGIIVRNADRSAPFASTAEEWILSGPHFFVANPFNKTPRAICTSNKQYDQLYLETAPDGYLPRSNYQPTVDHAAYARRIPCVPWSESENPLLPSRELILGEKTSEKTQEGQSLGVERGRRKPVTEYFRLVLRNMLAPNTERTLIPALAPKGTAHIHSVQSNIYRDSKDLIAATFMTCSIVGDFYIKSSGRAMLYGQWTLLPRLDLTEDLVSRTLVLNCVTKHYADLWRELFKPAFTDLRWSRGDDPRLPQRFFRSLTFEWQRNCALRIDYARRMALLELDVLVAQALNFTLDELILIYRVQFPVMQGYEQDTWYDARGQIAFTNSKGLVGVGLLRRGGRDTPKTRITKPDGTTREGNFGWDDLWTYANAEAGDSDEVLKTGGKPKVPDGTVITQWVKDDTMPGGESTAERTYVAPFARASREEDYRIAWDFFAAQGKA
jgi:hypothetical protein